MNNEVRFTKEQIMASEKYKEFYVLKELLKDGALYSIEDIDAMLAVYGRKAGDY